MSKAGGDILEEQASFLKDQLLEDDVKLAKELIGSLPEGDCINGLDPYYSKHQDYDLPVKDYLEAFNKGPCSPIVTLPGVTGSKLVAIVDCPTLQRESPEVFKACGWNTC